MTGDLTRKRFFRRCLVLILEIKFFNFKFVFGRSSNNGSTKTGLATGRWTTRRMTTRRMMMSRWTTRRMTRNCVIKHRHVA